MTIPTKIPAHTFAMQANWAKTPGADKKNQNPAGQTPPAPAKGKKPAAYQPVSNDLKKILGGYSTFKNLDALRVERSCVEGGAKVVIVSGDGKHAPIKGTLVQENVEKEGQKFSVVRDESGNHYYVNPKDILPQPKSIKPTRSVSKTSTPQPI